MKSTLSALVIVGLIASLVAGCATGGGPRHIDDTPDDIAAVESDWSRVSRLAPGAAIVLTTGGSRPSSRYFVVADDAAVIVLNLTLPTLPPAPTRILRDMAARHRDSLAQARIAGQFSQGNVRVGRDGVFVADRRIADLDQVIETVARTDVREIWGPVVARGSVLGTVVGGWLGFSIGVVPALGGASSGVAWLVLIVSTTVGGALGHRWSSHVTEGIVYSAP